MKLEQLIVQYLYQHKSVSLQDIGTFTLSPEIFIPEENAKDQSLPPNAIHFEYNGRQDRDEGLIEFIVAQTRKIRPLAASDLESYALLSRQFLNIGKPLIIDGIGTLQKTQQGSYDFVQTTAAHSRTSVAPAALREQVEEDISFTTPARTKSNGRGLMMALIAILILGVAGSLYYFFGYKPSHTIVPMKEPAPVEVAEDTTTSMLDTAVLKKNDTIVRQQVPLNTSTSVRSLGEGVNFAIIIKQYRTKAEADRAYSRLTNFGHKIVVQSVDSSSFRIIMPFTTPISDTTRAKDSLRRFFDAKTEVLL